MIHTKRQGNSGLVARLHTFVLLVMFPVFCNLRRSHPRHFRQVRSHGLKIPVVRITKFGYTYVVCLEGDRFCILHSRNDGRILIDQLNHFVRRHTWYHIQQVAHFHGFPRKNFGFVHLIAEFGVVFMTNGGVLIELLLKCFGM